MTPSPSSDTSSATTVAVPPRPSLQARTTLGPTRATAAAGPYQAGVVLARSPARSCASRTSLSASAAYSAEAVGRSASFSCDGEGDGDEGMGMREPSGGAGDLRIFMMSSIFHQGKYFLY